MTISPADERRVLDAVPTGLWIGGERRLLPKTPARSPSTTPPRARC